MKVLVACFDEESFGLDAGTMHGAVFLETKAKALRFGRNGLLVGPDSLAVHAVYTAEGAFEPEQPIAFEPGDVFSGQREGRKRMDAALSALAPSVWHIGMRPLIYMVVHEDRVDFYREAETADTEVLALRFASAGATGLQISHRSVSALLFDQSEAMVSRGPLFSTRWNYSQWRSDLEFERKYTYHPLPDIWKLAVGLHRELRSGDYAGFFPEPHWGFQVFDYENHIFDVTEPPEEAGYISFIPQIDGLVTVKRKWFRENSEIRRESLWPHQALPVAGFLEAARDRVKGRVRTLPPFRRKRFDVNYESLETGHIYGVYFDICTTIDAGPVHRFGQAEVEYCRSRTLFPLTDVRPEFEALALHIEEYLAANGVEFERNLFSKLDFAREAAALRKAAG